MRKPPGLFFTGTDTGVGKTYVAALVARALVADGRRVGVYKPVASGCRREADQLISDDAVALWEAADRPGTLDHVCPQRFAAPLAPHLAARAEGRRVDPELLRRGIDYWRERSDIVLVEGAGGLMSPVSDEDYVADLSDEFGYPLVVVARNAIGVINQTLQTLIAAATLGIGLPVAGIVLNRPSRTLGGETTDPSVESNHDELSQHVVPPVLADIRYAAIRFDPTVDWFALGRVSAGKQRSPS